VLADLRETSPDLVFHGGDLADGGSSPVEVVDRIRDLCWPGVAGNGEEALFNPESLEEFAARSQAAPSLWAAVREMMASTREALGDERIAWLGSLPRVQIHGLMALVHASPDSPWRAPGLDASDVEMESVYSPLGRPLAIYGHIHRPFVRNLPGMVVANAGSVSLSYDGDRRASYLLVDGSRPAIRRVEYDVNREIQVLTGCSRPHTDWVARTLMRACFQAL
jgi:diadenosine tetraphosphatase ApaH/serine/threonine PP2A family protein phosphatase